MAACLGSQQQGHQADCAASGGRARREEARTAAAVAGGSAGHWPRRQQAAAPIWLMRAARGCICKIESARGIQQRRMLLRPALPPLPLPLDLLQGRFLRSALDDVTPLHLLCFDLSASCASGSVPARPQAVFSPQAPLPPSPSLLRHLLIAPLQPTQGLAFPSLPRRAAPPLCHPPRLWAAQHPRPAVHPTRQRRRRLRRRGMELRAAAAGAPPPPLPLGWPGLWRLSAS